MGENGLLICILSFSFGNSWPTDLFIENCCKHYLPGRGHTIGPENTPFACVLSALALVHQQFSSEESSLAKTKYFAFSSLVKLTWIDSQKSLHSSQPSIMFTDWTQVVVNIIGNIMFNYRTICKWKKMWIIQ